MSSIKEKIVSWSVAKVTSPKNKLWLGIMSFAESSFFPIPPDVLLIGILLTKERINWFYYASLTTITSILGGLFGYLIGFAFFSLIGEPIINFYGLHEEVTKVGVFFNEHAFFSIFTAAFTPIPYKVFTISAGFFKLNIFIFVVASILGRGLRFYIVSYLVFLFGERVSRIIYKYFNILSLLFVIILGVVIFILF